MANKNSHAPQLPTADVPLEIAEPVQTAFIEMPKEEESEKIDKRAWFLALAKVCRVNVNSTTEKVKMQVGQSARILREKEGATPEEITAFGDWWFAYHWIGQKNQAPRPAQVREFWERFKQGEGINGKRTPGEGVIKTLDDGSRVRVLRDEEHDITMTIPYVEGPRIVYHNRGE